MAVRIAAVSTVLVLLVAACGGGAGEGASEAPTAGDGSAENKGDGGPAASFASPKGGDKVTSPVQLKMKAQGVKIEESGVVKKGAGHFHVMIDTKCVPNGKPIPEDAKHVHYGDASTSAKLKLKPGDHSLCLQLGNGAHRALGKTDTVKVTVK